MRALLRHCRVDAAFEHWACRGDTLLNPLEADPAARRAFLLEAVCKADLSVAATRKGMGGLLSLDVAQARRALGAIKERTAQAALRSVFAGDCVVRAQTRHWQGHDGRCSCGLALETRAHFFWECPATLGARGRVLRSLGALTPEPQGIERELGLPLLNPRVAE